MAATKVMIFAIGVLIGLISSITLFLINSRNKMIDNQDYLYISSPLKRQQDELIERQQSTINALKNINDLFSYEETQPVNQRSDYDESY